MTFRLEVFLAMSQSIVLRRARVASWSDLDMGMEGWWRWSFDDGHFPSSTRTARGRPRDDDDTDDGPTVVGENATTTPGGRKRHDDDDVDDARRMNKPTRAAAAGGGRTNMAVRDDEGAGRTAIARFIID